MDPCSCRDRTADQWREPQRRGVAHLGIPHNCQVMYGHDPSSLASRRDYKFRPVHDIGASDEPLDRWARAVSPGPGEGFCGHGKLSMPDSRRKQWA